MRVIVLFIFVYCLIILQAYSQAPAGYYDGTQGLTGNALRYKLHDIISNGFTSVSYSSLYTHYQTTDKKANGKVWDMYSDVPGGIPPYEYNFSQTCGNYSQEGDCYNREHTVPASWFNDAMPMYSDLFMVLPTDGYVNNRRSNYPYGKVGQTSWISQNGSKLGLSIVQGYTGTVFEPIDSFKGDFARIYFYVATRYKDKIPSWSSNTVFSGDNLSEWAKNLFLQWHYLDPVSAKEIQRNNAVFSIQHNRNPYVDHPEWVSLVWGNNDVENDDWIKYFIVYPTITSDNVNVVVYNENQILVDVFDLYGNKLISETFYSGKHTLLLNNFTKGIYIIMVKGKNFVKSFKIIKVT